MAGYNTKPVKRERRITEKKNKAHRKYAFCPERDRKNVCIINANIPKMKMPTETILGLYSQVYNSQPFAFIVPMLSNGSNISTLVSQFSSIVVWLFRVKFW